jgi:hypothetical protein
MMPAVVVVDWAAFSFGRRARGCEERGFGTFPPAGTAAA